MKALPHPSVSRVALSRLKAPRSCAPSDWEEYVALRFPKWARLLRHADFQRVYQRGRRHFAAHLTVFYLYRAEGGRVPSPGDTPRVGLTVGRALGGAVERNRIKRRLREAVRHNLALLVVPVDVVINPKKSALTADFTVLKDEVAGAFRVIAQKEARRT